MPADLTTEPARAGRQMASAANWERIGLGVHSATATTLQVDMPITAPRRLDCLTIRISLIREPVTLYAHASFGTVVLFDRALKRSPAAGGAWSTSHVLVGHAIESNLLTVALTKVVNAGGYPFAGFSVAVNAWTTLPGFRTEIRVDAPFAGSAPGSNLSLVTNVSVRHVNASAAAGVLRVTMDGNQRRV